jgi:hypothetical protein
LIPTGAIKRDDAAGAEVLFDNVGLAPIGTSGVVEHGLVRAVDGIYRQVSGPAAFVGCSL